jgi:prepilin signal peptidase PulO-like enzyme (type II secretory pathway)
MTPCCCVGSIYWCKCDRLIMKYRFVSHFFNLGHILKLGELTTDADLVSWNVGTQED